MSVTIINKVRKGDIVAIEERHSFTTQKPFCTESYSRFHLARVAKATRAGLATLATLPDGRSVKVGEREGDCFSISGERQTLARALFNGAPRRGRRERPTTV